MAIKRNAVTLETTEVVTLAPAPSDPPIPPETTLTVAVIEADALGKVIADRCDRPLRGAAIAGCSPYQRLTSTRAARLLLSPRRLRATVPPRSRFEVAITNVDNGSRSAATDLADLLTDAGIATELVDGEQGDS